LFPLQRFSSPEQRLELIGIAKFRSPAPSGFLNLLTPSSTPNLPALFHADPLLGLNPPELYSSHAAVRRLRRRYPHAVGPETARSDSNASPSAINLGSNEGSDFRAKRSDKATFPDFRVFLRARVRHGQRRFRPMHARSSPGLSPLQGVPPRRDGLAFTRASPHAVDHSGPEGPPRPPPQGVTHVEIGWSLSRLPTLLGFPTS